MKSASPKIPPLVPITIREVRQEVQTQMVDFTPPPAPPPPQQGDYVGQVDGGYPGSNYGGTYPVDGGTP